ncbi:hypothetical protein SKAU_G00179110 [Synaphobranchus kaupii]|uniref:DUF4585 domain-containing protein n=1 Tax=Synaphobranchus kaupii TaxID=118154 RepID=A0A9Q1FM12_SYNKA|nr:hypothetical protein SKAU_G00179110 [Synaphobranchus kaupii]
MNSQDKRHGSYRGSMQGYCRYGEGFGDGSGYMDETDREVSNLTDRAFRSLCIGEEAVYNDSSPVERHKAFADDAPNEEAAGTSRIGPTFQRSVPDEVKQERAFAARTVSHHSNGVIETTWQQKRSSSKVSSLIRAFSAGYEENVAVTTDAAVMSQDSMYKQDSESWEGTALLSIQKELSEFSSVYHQSIKGSPYPQTRNLFGSSEAAVAPQIPSNTESSAPSPTFMKSSSSSKCSGKVKKPSSRNFFLHSEFSPFQTWKEYNRHLYDREVVPNVPPTSQSPRWYDSPFYKELTVAHRNQMAQLEEKRSHRRQYENLLPAEPPASTVRQKASAVEKRSESEVTLSCPPWRRSQEPVKNKVPQNRPCTASPVSDRSRRKEEGLVPTGRTSATNQKVQMVADDQTSNSGTPFSISQLLTPMIHPRQETETSEILQYALSPNILDPQLSSETDPRTTPEVKPRNKYKAMASSLLFNLKDNRKRVKSTYTPTMFKSVEIPDHSKQPSQLDSLIAKDGSVTSDTPLSWAGAPVRSNRMDLQSVNSPVVQNAKTYDVNYARRTEASRSDDYLTLISPQTVREGSSYRSFSHTPQESVSVKDKLADVQRGRHVDSLFMASNETPNEVLLHREQDVAPHREKGQTRQEMLTSKLKAHAEKEIFAIKGKGHAKLEAHATKPKELYVHVNKEGEPLSAEHVKNGTVPLYGDRLANQDSAAAKEARWRDGALVDQGTSSSVGHGKNVVIGDEENRLAKPAPTTMEKEHARNYIVTKTERIGIRQEELQSIARAKIEAIAGSRVHQPKRASEESGSAHLTAPLNLSKNTESVMTAANVNVSRAEAGDAKKHDVPAVKEKEQVKMEALPQRQEQSQNLGPAVNEIHKAKNVLLNKEISSVSQVAALSLEHARNQTEKEQAAGDILSRREREAEIKCLDEENIEPRENHPLKLEVHDTGGKEHAKRDVNKDADKSLNAEIKSDGLEELSSVVLIEAGVKASNKPKEELAWDRVGQELPRPRADEPIKKGSVAKHKDKQEVLPTRKTELGEHVHALNKTESVKREEKERTQQETRFSENDYVAQGTLARTGEDSGSFAHANKVGVNAEDRLPSTPLNETVANVERHQAKHGLSKRDRENVAHEWAPAGGTENPENKTSAVTEHRLARQEVKMTRAGDAQNEALMNRGRDGAKVHSLPLKENEQAQNVRSVTDKIHQAVLADRSGNADSDSPLKIKRVLDRDVAGGEGHRHKRDGLSTSERAHAQNEALLFDENLQIKLDALARRRKEKAEKCARANVDGTNMRRGEHASTPRAKTESLTGDAAQSPEEEYKGRPSSRSMHSQMAKSPEERHVVEEAKRNTGKPGEALQYYAIINHERKTEAGDGEAASSQRQERMPRREESGLVHGELNDGGWAQGLMDYAKAHTPTPRSNASSPSLGKPVLFKVKDNTLRGSPVTKTVKPCFHKTLADDQRPSSSQENLSGVEKGDEECDRLKENVDVPVPVPRSAPAAPPRASRSRELPGQHSLPAADFTTARALQARSIRAAPEFAAARQQPAHNVVSTPEFISAREPRSYYRRSRHLEEDGRRSVVSTMSEDLESCATSATGVSAGVYMENPCERPESACSDVRALGKPPSVPPKSEKALRRAQRLNTRRIQKAEALVKAETLSQTERKPLRAVASMPSSPTEVLRSRQAVPAYQPAPPQFCVESGYAPHAPGLLAQPFPVTQRRLLQDPNSGQYFVVDMPVQVKTKMFFDPETGKYVQLSVRESPEGTRSNAPSSVELLSPPPYVLYPGFLPMPVSSLPPLRSTSQMSAPAALMDDQDKRSDAWRQEALRRKCNREAEPYIEPAYGSRGQPGEKPSYDVERGYTSPRNLNILPMSELEDFAMESA